ncbi:MAG: MFS transporter [Thermomicrobiales bacterium]|nr:MFS transporter [Thermomicrobiales bacterium]
MKPVAAEGTSYRAVIGRPKPRVLATIRATQKLGGATLAYGAMVYLARGGADQLQVSLVNASSFLAALLFGFQNGIIVDSMTKRTAIALGFVMQSALCFLIPMFRGTETGDLMLLIFLSSAISQLISPGIKAAVSLVSSERAMATTASFVMVSGSVASAAGSTLIAPGLIRFTSLDTLLYVVSGLFLVGAVRAFALPADPKHPDALPAHHLRSMRSTARDILRNRSTTGMLLLGAVATALYEATTTMLPVYASDVLDVDPANTVYVFAPAAIGFLLGIVTFPWIVRWVGERRLTVAAIFVLVAGMTAFGLIAAIAPYLAPLSPLRLLEPFGLHLSDRVLGAGVLAIPTNLGSSLASMSVQVFINRTIATEHQGSVFGLQDVVKNALNVVAVIAVGVFALVIPIEYVLLATPAVVIILVLRLISVTGRHETGRPMSTREAWRLLVGHPPSQRPSGPSPKRHA